MENLDLTVLRMLNQLEAMEARILDLEAQISELQNPRDNEEDFSIPNNSANVINGPWQSNYSGITSITGYGCSYNNIFYT